MLVTAPILGFSISSLFQRLLETGQTVRPRLCYSVVAADMNCREAHQAERSFEAITALYGPTKDWLWPLTSHGLMTDWGNFSFIFMNQVVSLSMVQ
jgi:hypothetical protein